MADGWKEATGAKRTHDLPGEERPFKPVPQKQSKDSTGFTSQVAGIATDDIMERAIADKLKQASQEAAAKDSAGAASNEVFGDQPEALPSAAELDSREDNGREDDSLEALRNRRRQQMKDAQEKKQKYIVLGHGSYDEIPEEDFIKTVTASERAVVHFYHRSFERCKIMDMHLAKCARKFLGTRFVRMDSEKAPFFVEKLKVQTLPCAIVFFNGVATGRQVGFDTLGGDEFQTATLAWRFKEGGGIEEDFGMEDEF